MGQAKNRKAEILALKAQSVIKPFIRRASLVDGVAKFDTTGLDDAQVKWCEGAELALADTVTHMENVVISDADCLAFTFYHNKSDFLTTVMAELKCQPDTEWAEILAKFNASVFGLKSGDFIPVLVSSECIVPSLSEDYKIKANNDWFMMMYNKLHDTGTLMSPDNSYPPLRVDKQRFGWVVI